MAARKTLVVDVSDAIVAREEQEESTEEGDARTARVDETAPKGT